MVQKKQNEYMLQITSGRGPEECWRVVAKVVEILLKEARSEGHYVEVVHSVAGHLSGTLLSSMVLIKGNAVEPFIEKWNGTVQWIAQSPFRKYHKRKNWFVGVAAVDMSEVLTCYENDIVYETLRASGPGGQHVNKTESAVRAKHVPSGTSVLVSERRSQHQNKAEARERLKLKVQEWNLQQIAEKIKDQWQQHNTLKRGNAVRVFEDRL